MVTNAGVSAVLYTHGNIIYGTPPFLHLNAVVTPETCSVYVAFEFFIYLIILKLNV